MHAVTGSPTPWKRKLEVPLTIVLLSTWQPVALSWSHVCWQLQVSAGEYTRPTSFQPPGRSWLIMTDLRPVSARQPGLEVSTAVVGG